MCRSRTAPQPSMRAGGGTKSTLPAEGTSSCTSCSMAPSCRVAPVHSRHDAYALHMHTAYVRMCTALHVSVHCTVYSLNVHCTGGTVWNWAGTAYSPHIPALTARWRVQGLDYDYEMFATEAGRGVFATADLDGDGRIDIAGFSKIVHVRHRPLITLTVQHSPKPHAHVHTCRATTRSHALPTCQHTQCTPSVATPRAGHLTHGSPRALV